MRQGRIFWGTLFIVVGVLGLLNEFGVVLHLNINSDWVIPLLLVLLGLTFIAKQNKLKLIIILIAGLISGLAVYSYFWDNDGNGHFKAKIEIKDDEEDEDLLADDNAETTNTVPYYKLEKMRLKLFSAASELNLRGIETTKFTAKLKGTRYDMDFHKSGEKGTLKIKHQKGETSSLSLKKLDVLLNDEPEYKVTVKSGASDLNLDLSDLKVNTLKAEIAATDAEIKFGDKQDSLNAELKFAASEVTIHIPENVGCLLKGDYFLVDNKPAGFQLVNQNKYETPNYDTAEKKINIDLKGALGDFEIKFY